ncbi:hypothetical protein [Methanofollis fontis]|uniref:Uncharacterized protein n=1 Tax=Methanofollis fontis TaxID=2052832 RepID=A0A483CYF8_9EURY|nr:hypothetical protein [Methanofollis fontis]TAJ44666.1 hypothetical protein CUJ86_04995 [Methanofollis fontis]
MKRIVLPLLCLLSLLLVGQASAAQVYMDIPKSVNEGQPLEVVGTTTGASPGYAFEVVFYDTTYAKSEIARQQVVLQADGSFSVTFQTDGLKGGTYSIEIAESGDGIFGGTKKPVILTIVNRTADLTITSPLSQAYDGTLLVAGSVKGLGDAGIQLSVTGPGGANVYGPRWIATTGGAFSQEVPITQGGRYVAGLMDNTSYVWSVDFTVTGGIVTVAPTTAATPAEGPTYSAAAQASRSTPAYFVVETLGGPVTITTSSGIDWVVEYIDESGGRTMVNNQGTSAPEQITLQARGGTVYVKVYPQLYTESGRAVITGKNVKSVAVDASVAERFGDPVPTTTESPLPLWSVPAALGALLLFRRR